MLARPWGNRGELLADSRSAHAHRLEGLRRAFLISEAPGAEPRAVEIESARPYRGRWIVKLRGVDSIAQAAPFGGARLCVPRHERPAAPEGEYYQADLIGCEVIEQATGRRIGRVEDCIETGGADLLRVAGERSGEEILIPFARSICVRIDLEGRRILVDLPEGLEDLNRP